MNIGHAVATAFKIGTTRKLQAGDTDDSEQIGWGYGIAGIALLVIVQVGMILMAGATTDQFRDLALVAAVSLGGPFVIYLLVALMTRNVARLPASFLYLGLILTIVQIISYFANSFASGSTFILGATAVLVATGARGFFKVNWFVAIIVGILTLGAIIGAAMLLYQLPTGRFLR